MKYLLDTDVFGMAARDGNPLLRQRLHGIEIEDLFVSVVTIGEVEFGLAKKPPPAIVIARMEQFRAAMQIVPLDLAAARRYGALRNQLQKVGTPIGPNDLWIASHALALDLTLVTGNEREFARIPTLRVENWMR